MAPYPNPVVHMNQKRQQQSQVQMPQQMNSYSNPNMQPSYNAAGPPQVIIPYDRETKPICADKYETGTLILQFPNGYAGSRGGMSFQSQFPGQQNMGGMNSYNPMSSQGAGSRGNMRQSTPPYSNTSVHQNGPMQSHQYFMPNGQYPPNSTQFQQEVTSMRGGSYQHSPIPVGNPTPPLTPASNMPPYAMSPNADIKPNINEMKPNITVPSKCYSISLLLFLAFVRKNFENGVGYAKSPW